jgi:translation initiation factor 5B
MLVAALLVAAPLAGCLEPIGDATKDAVTDGDPAPSESEAEADASEQEEVSVAEVEEAQQRQVLENITRPARFEILDDHVFRQSDPAVVGVEIRGGLLRRNTRVARFEGDEPERVGTLKSIQDEGEDVEQARTGERVAVSIDGPTVGRQIEEGDVLWTEIPEKHAKILEQELAEDISADEREVLSMYLDRQRNRDPFWGK